MLSSRANQLIKSKSAIMDGHLLCATDPFSESNGSGYLNFGIAENHLMADHLLKYSSEGVELEANDLQYFDLSGLPSLKNVTSNFFERYFSLPGLQSESFVFMNGLSSVCECLSYSMFDPGDYLMIPTPYYTGFDFDFRARFRVKFLEVPLSSSFSFQHRVEDFEKAWNECDNKSRVKAIIITHPHNPTGEVLSEKFLIDIVDFARERDLDIITDEIYGLTNFSSYSHKSLLSVAKDYRHRIHFLYGLAKDFTLAGFKVGIYYSENEQFVKAMQLLSYFHCTSSMIQRFTEKLLSDYDFIDSFIKENNRRLLEIRNKIFSEVPEFQPIYGNSGLFFLANLKSYLRQNTMQGETELFESLLTQHKIFFTAGRDLGLKEPGYFRVCFAKPMHHVDQLILRMRNFCDQF